MGKVSKNIPAKKYITYLTSVFLVPLLVVLLVYTTISLKSFQNVNNELAQTGQKTIDMYQQLLEQELRKLSSQTANLWFSDTYHRYLSGEADALTRYYAQFKIADIYRGILSENTSLGGMGLYAPANEVGVAFFREGQYSYDLTRQLREQMKQIADHADTFLKEGFMPREISDRHFLFRVIGNPGAYTVLMIDMDEVTKYQNQNNQPNGGFLYYADLEGRPFCGIDTIGAEVLHAQAKSNKPYFITDTKPAYLATGRTSQMMKLEILYFMPYYPSITAMKTMHLVLAVFSLLLLALTPVFYRLLRKSVFEPIDKLDETMRRIQKGNLDERAEENYKIREFYQVNRTFNQMIADIQNLKIARYETELQKGHAQLQYLQLQLRPHFFLNCLKILYSMVEQKKYDRVQQMVLQVSVYLRSKFQDVSTCITVREELDFVENYVHLQRDSMLQAVFYHGEVEPLAWERRIPVLLIQTFVENSFKYARRPDTALEISISAVLLPSEDGDLLDIVIQDNGTGYDSRILQRINQLDEGEFSHESIGIANVKQRLSLLYGDKAMLQLSNLPTGAQAEIILPV